MINDGQEFYNLSEEMYSWKRSSITSSYRTERKQWDKSNPIPELSYSDSNKNLINNKRYEDHLKKLQQNNQNIKLTKQTDSKTENLKKLEAGFCVYINGAHRKKERYALRHTIVKSFDINKNQKSENQEYGKSKVKTSRKKWAESSFTIKTSDGYMIKINAPNSEYVYKSENMKSCESNENEKNNLSDNSEQNDYFSDKNKSSDSSGTDTEEIENSNRKIMVELTPKDAKTLRKNMTIYDKENIRKCLDFKIEDDEKAKTKFKLEEYNHLLEEDKSADICEIILSKVVNLKEEDRMSLINFLTEIEENANKSNPK